MIETDLRQRLGSNFVNTNGLYGSHRLNSTVADIENEFGFNPDDASPVRPSAIGRPFTPLSLDRPTPPGPNGSINPDQPAVSTPDNQTWRELRDQTTTTKAGMFRRAAFMFGFEPKSYKEHLKASWRKIASQPNLPTSSESLQWQAHCMARASALRNKIETYDGSERTSETMILDSRYLQSLEADQVTELRAAVFDRMATLAADCFENSHGKYGVTSVETVKEHGRTAAWILRTTHREIYGSGSVIAKHVHDVSGTLDTPLLFVVKNTANDKRETAGFVTSLAQVRKVAGFGHGLGASKEIVAAMMEGEYGNIPDNTMIVSMSTKGSEHMLKQGEAMRMDRTAIHIYHVLETLGLLGTDALPLVWTGHSMGATETSILALLLDPRLVDTKNPRAGVILASPVLNNSKQHLALFRGLTGGMMKLIFHERLPEDLRDMLLQAGSVGGRRGLTFLLNAWSLGVRFSKNKAIQRKITQLHADIQKNDPVYIQECVRNIRRGVSWLTPELLDEIVNMPIVHRLLLPGKDTVLDYRVRAADHVRRNGSSDERPHDIHYHDPRYVFDLIYEKLRSMGGTFV